MKFEVNRGAFPRAAAPSAQLLEHKPERKAWLVLWAAFGICIALWALVPFFGIEYVRTTTVAQMASLEAAPITPDKITPVRVTLPNSGVALAVIDATEIAEASRVETDTTDNSRAFLTFFDKSTAKLLPNTQIVLSEMRVPQFGVSENMNRVVIEQTRGVVRYSVTAPLMLAANATPRKTQFLVRTPHFDAWLTPGGSYAIEVNNNGSQVSVSEGSAAVRSRDGSRDVFVEQGQRVLAQVGKSLGEPIPAAQDLLVNGDFAEPIDCNPNATGPWKCYSDQGGDGGDINGAVGVVTKDDRRAVWIRREGSNQNSAITGIRQIIDRDISDYRSLKLSAYVRVESHNLSGGGYLSTEYPLILRIRYRDVNGDEAEYVRGYYAQNDAGNPTANGELTKSGIWNPIDSSNLLAGLPIKPFRILSIEIYASGWDYESYISNVQLTVE